MVPDYIPPKDADYDDWFLNFDTLLTAAPTTYGLTAPDAVIVGAQYDLWHPAYLLATNPATRTAPTVAAKDALRISTEAIIRPYAQAISRNAAVDNLDKVAIGVNLPNATRPPIPAPATQPALSLKAGQPLQHQLAYKDASLGDTKAKPVGSIGVEIWRAVGVAPAVDPAACQYLDTWTKSPNVSDFDPAQQGKIATYFARFVTKAGPGGKAQKGPWSAPLVLTVM